MHLHEQPYGVKIEQTAKGLRVTVHCYGPADDVVHKAVDLYTKTVMHLEQSGFKVAPMEA